MEKTKPDREDDRYGFCRTTERCTKKRPSNPGSAGRTSGRIEADRIQMESRTGTARGGTDCDRYAKVFRQMIQETADTYEYSLEDAMLELKDLFAQTYMDMIKK